MIVQSLARMIVREHMYKPITGKVLFLGRQTISMTYEQCIELLNQEHYSVPENILKSIKTKYDTQTRSGQGLGYITDEVFFGLLGIKNFHVMDVSAYEGADIVHNLNEPIPQSLENQFDFIIDGGTFDHLIDLKIVFVNVIKMLKAGGRIFQWNAASNFTGSAYISFGPDVFYDFYSLNRFADCKVYLAEVDTIGQKEAFDMYEFKGDNRYDSFFSKRVVMVIVMAEKGSNSSFNLLPVQSQYRDPQISQIYKDNQKMIGLSPRKSWVGSAVGIKVSKPITIFIKIDRAYKEGGLPLIWVRFSRRVAALFNKKDIYEKDRLEGFKYIGQI